MSKGFCAGAFALLVGFSASGLVVQSVGGDEPKKPTAEATRAQEVAKPTVADKFATIKTEFEAQKALLRDAVEKAKDEREQMRLYSEMSPDDVIFSRRMVDLALEAPKEEAARDALIWVINKPYRGDEGPYGDEFGRAAALLVRHHGDDPIAVSVGLGLENAPSTRRESLLFGFYASAKSSEAKGLARLALGRYLMAKPKPEAGSPQALVRQKIVYKDVIDVDGVRRDKSIELSDERYAEQLINRLNDPKATMAEAVRLLEEVVSDYADIPCISLKRRELRALLNDPNPKSNGKELTKEELEQLKRYLAHEKTLGQVAGEALDEINNLGVGSIAPEIDGVDIEGKPLKLSDYRGKFVALVFWGSWCGPCMREVPYEKKLLERLKDKPFAILGVNCADEKDVALKTMKDEGITWPNWYDWTDTNGPINSRYHVRSYPTVVVIDPHGKIALKGIPASFLDEYLDELIAKFEKK